MPKLVFITSRFPYPLEKGDKLRAFFFIKELSKNYEVVLISLSDKKIEKKQFQKIEEICAKVYCLQLNKATIFLNMLFGFFSSKPFQVHYFYSYFKHIQITKILEKEIPDHIFCQLIRVSEYVKNYHECPKTIDYMDALSKGMERRKEIAPFTKKWLFNMEYNRLLNYERLVFDYFEHKLMISEQDSKYVLHDQKKSIKVIPNGIDDSFFIKPNVKPQFDIVFVGNLSYAPNIDAVEYLLNKILPATNFTCLISGASPSKYLRNKISKMKNVSLWADVKDIKVSYCSARVFVAPLFIGTGLQNKLLEAMSLGVPCITTTLVNNSLQARDGVHLEIANSSSEFIQKINNLLLNEEKSLAIAKEATKFIKENYSWEKSIKLYIDSME